MEMIIVKGIQNCLPCKLLHNRLLNEGIDHQYNIVDGEVGVCYPQVIVDGVVLNPMTIDGYIRALKG